MDALGFRCTACGNCCRKLRVALTIEDLSRLMRATGRHASELVDWLSPDEVDMTGEPGSFVELDAGRRLLVLAQAGGACRLLGSDDRCTAYAARPLDCRTFPFDFTPAPGGAVCKRLVLLPLPECDAAADGAQRYELLRREDARRWRALARYQELVANWNRLARWRRRLRHPVGGPAHFLSFGLKRLGRPVPDLESVPVSGENF